ncbi:hypothetical protein HETIRDRAFT_309703 [Heterobasidion irregulare TC 32-1]|uniref:Replication protein A subunit n=1 Tax=Heterobasidion irregulare (strain TC 32-1) TaxID=747525 RepID=W4KLF0_HETIT|nr:uncharacterized protein HETIRDRAFT_309703 [Heterobasidion irregulare TC 32-1]ETW86185.1 hypothetical protein HETIRDRAFT_309703 [Heterobasidion irregulare TC 32-1]
MSSSTPQLTSGICERLQVGDRDDQELWDSSPIVQFLSIKKVSAGIATGSSSSTDRFRIIVSDGVHFVQAMLATQLNHLVEEAVISKNTVAKLEKITCNVIQEKRLVVILALSVVHKEAPKIGTPTAFGPDKVPGSSIPAKDTPTSSSTAVSTLVPAPAPAPAPASARSGGAPSASTQRGGRNSTIFPIEGLSPYQNNWKIRARVTHKSDIRTYSNQRGEGKFFNVTFMDDTGEIKGTGFNAVVDELYEKLQEDKVYFISKARVNLSKKKFSSVSNEYELSLERTTEIEECLDTANLPVVKYNFVELSGLQDLTKDSLCDVIGIVKDIGDLGEINTKANRTIQKRELTLVDRSAFSVRLTLWGKQAEQFNASPSTVIAFKGVKVGEFGGRSLSMFSSSTMAVSPDISEAHLLRGWYDDGGASTSFTAHSSAGAGSGASINRNEMRTISEVKDAQLGMNEEKPDYFSTRATIMHIKSDNISYPACHTEGCSKKVVESHDGWRCEKCDRSYPKPQYRYIMSMAVADHTGQVWLQGFNDVGVAVFGKTADEVHEIKENDEAAYNDLMLKATCHTYMFGCRAKQDTFNDQTRVRYGITRIQPVDFAAEARIYIDLLRSPWAQ